MTRKQVYELANSDFIRCPVWEFALDEEGAEGQDEATVRPYLYDGDLDPSLGMPKGILGTGLDWWHRRRGKAERGSDLSPKRPSPSPAPTRGV